MKLCNKKTGDIVEVLTDSIAVNVLRDKEDITGYYTSLAELNEEWEDYTPAEPLIKDEKIRKAVRAWADTNGIDKKVEYNAYSSDGSCSFVFTYKGGEAELLLDFRYIIDNLKSGKYYTIAELCGEDND